MVQRDRLDRSELDGIFRRLRRLEAAADLGYASVSRGSLRILSNEGFLVEGSAKVIGWLIVTGTERVTGTLEVLGDLIASGTISLTGPLTQTGDSDFTGDIDITGDLHIDGTTTLTKTMTVNSPGKIVFPGGASPLTLQSGEMSFASGGVIDGTSGLRMQMPGGGFISLQAGIAQMLIGTNYVAITSAGTTINGPVFAPSKSFLIDHPTKPDKKLRHGSTEGPTHGIEYHGTVDLDDDGVGVVELPDYFESIALTEGRTAHLTPIGAAFVPWYEHPIADGKVVVHGDSGASVSWLVKADRELFDVEPDASLFPGPVPEPTTD